MWALMWYGVDESACYGIVSEQRLADEWEYRGEDNKAVAFELNAVPPMERWRDSKMFPFAPRTGPAESHAEKMLEYMNFTMCAELLPLPSGSGSITFNKKPGVVLPRAVRPAL